MGEIPSSYKTRRYFIARNPTPTKGQFGGDFAGVQTLPARRFEATTFLQLSSPG